MEMNNVTVALGTGSPLVYADFAGADSVSISFKVDGQEITSFGDKWKRLSGLEGIKAASVSLSGKAFAGTESTALRTHFMAGTFAPIRIEGSTDDDVQMTVTGTYKVTSLEFSNSVGELMTFSMSLESSGTVTVADAT